MRFIYTCLLVSLVVMGSAQAPFLVNYQGVARDSSGNALANQAISLKFEVLQGVSGPAIYTENQNLTTSPLGVFATQIGKTVSLAQVNWQGGSYYLQVSMDPAGGSNLVPLGTQQIVSVPFAMHAQNVPSTYSNNVLGIGTKTYAISSGTAVSVSGSGTNISVSAGPDYTISFTPPAAPQLALSANNASLSIVGSNTVVLPVAQPATLVPSGIVTVTNGASSYTVGVPAPSYNQQSGVMTLGGSSTLVTPTLGLAGGILYSGPFTNSVAIPSAVTVAGTGLASVTGGPNYLVNVAPPQLALSSNNLSISIVGSNSVALPTPVTVVSSGNIVSVSGGPATYSVSVPAPTFNGTVLTLGATTTTIAPILVFNSSTGVLTSGAANNSVSINNFGPFVKAGTSVSLTTATDNLALGLNSTSAKLEVYSNVSSGNVIKATNASLSNTSPAVDISSANGTGISVVNTSAGGVAAEFNSTGGYAINATSSSGSIPTIYANNTNATGESGYFNGRVIVSGKDNSSSNFAMKVQDNASSNLLVVRNDGHVGIGTASPSQKLDVNGSVKITDGSEGDGKVLTSDASGNASWQPITITTAANFTGAQNLLTVNATPSPFSTSLATFTKVYSDTKVQVIVQTHIYVDDLVGTNAAIYEIRVGTTQAGNNTGKTPYFLDNAAAGTSFPKCQPVTMIAEFPASVFSSGPGSYTINMFVSGGTGVADNVWIDPGNFGTNSIIIKEYR